MSTPGSSVVSDDVSFSTTSSTASSAVSATVDDVPYNMWFLKAVAKWLDIALFKAVRRILKAVELVSFLNKTILLVLTRWPVL